MHPSHKPPSHGRAQLITCNPLNGRREGKGRVSARFFQYLLLVLHLDLNEVLRIGRDPALCNYVISDRHVSALHFELNVVASSDGGVIVSCRDCSKNGVYLNEHLFKKTSVIVMNGDTLTVPQSLAFTCLHNKSFNPMPLQPSYKTIGKFSVSTQCLGSGGFATVHLAMDRHNHCQVACKKFRTPAKGTLTGEAFTSEVAILTRLKHPQINRMVDAEKEGNYTYIFLELCTGGDLFTYVADRAGTHGCLHEPEAKFVAFQLLHALRYLHSQKIAHRDIKPENILLRRPGPFPGIVLADFGMARTKSFQETLNVCGTVSYLPPEGVVALDDEYAGYRGLPADCWSVGVTLYIMIAGTHPFDYEGGNDWIVHIRESQLSSECSQRYLDMEARLKLRIIRGQVDFTRPPWSRMQTAQRLTQHLLTTNYRERATVDDAFEHFWFADEIETLERLRLKMST